MLFRYLAFKKNQNYKGLHLMILENTRLKFFHAEKIFIVFFIVFLQLTDALDAQVSHSQEMNLTTSTDVELKASYSHEITVPFLNSPNVLFENNEKIYTTFSRNCCSCSVGFLQYSGCVCFCRAIYLSFG